MSRTRLRKHIFLWFTGLFIICAVLASYATYLSMVSAVNKNDASIIPFAVSKGESTLGIASRLHSEGLIRSIFGFRLEVKRTGLAGKLQAGDYRLSPNMSALEIAQALTTGRDTEIKVTIPEGLRIEEIAEKIAAELGISTADFLVAAKGTEGSLFPDTYFFAKESTAQDVVKRMKDEYASKTKDLNLSQSDLILASLIERETRGDAEKPIVAGILQKRLQNNWPLQLDATIQYIAGKKGEWWPNTTLLDRQRPSLYNTYLHQGLPPGPICNPSIESMKAAINPIESEYWYYLHDRDRVIRYAVTSEEHNANIAKYIR